MKRTTVYLDEGTDLELARIARRQARSKAELIREALDRFVQAERAQKQPLPSWVGAGRSGIPDLAERDEELLDEIFEEEYERVMAEWEATHGEKRR
jgi:predicted transcriptional regulator